MIAASLPILLSLWMLTTGIIITNIHLVMVSKRMWKTVEELDEVKFVIDLHRVMHGEDPIFYIQGKEGHD